jgi:putative aminopeptidase
MSMQQRLSKLTQELMLIPGLAGYETRVRKCIAATLKDIGITTSVDVLGNLVATLPGQGPSVMLIAHMDQLGFIVRKIEANGLIRLERLGGVPERALAAQEVLICVGEGRVPYAELYVDAGFASAEQAHKAGVDVGSPVVYAPRAFEMAGGRIGGTSVDDRAACALLIELARALKGKTHPTLHLVFSVQEEFNLRGAITAAQTLQPDICIQLDLVLATDTPDMSARGDVRLGGGPAMAMYSFHGRGTLNGLIPHPALVHLFDKTARKLNMPLQRSAHTGALTETSYVQLVGKGVACIDMGFPCRYTHSALEVFDPADLAQLAELLTAALTSIGPGFSLNRDDFDT